MTAELKALRDIFSASIDKIDQVCTASGKDFPSLDQPVQISEFTPGGIRNDPRVARAIGTAVAAAFQAIQTLQPPAVTLAKDATIYTLPLALGIVERANVAEIIRPAGSKGMHVNDIASKSNIDPKKLARVLRLLATNHWFKEVAPDVFANNLLSSLLDTGKEATADFGLNKHKETPGLAALVGYFADESFKAAAHFQDVLFDPKMAFSEEMNEAGFQKALGIQLDLWSYYDSPEGRYRGSRFAAAMPACSKLHPPQAILTGFSWDSVPKDGLVVDVGGGTGHVGLEIAKAFPELDVVIEDRPVTLESARAYWKANLPSHIESGKVHFVGCDFLGPQPTLPATPDVFLLRMILHGLSDKYCIRLLCNLRNAAGLDTKLVIIDCIIGYTCETLQKPGIEAAQRPLKPLLQNLGGANLLAYEFDLVLMAMIHSAERTVDGFESIIEAGGWKLVEIRKHPMSEIWWPSIICVPA